MPDTEEQIEELRNEIAELHHKFDNFTSVMDRRFDYLVIFAIILLIVLFFPFRF